MEQFYDWKITRQGWQDNFWDQKTFIHPLLACISMFYTLCFKNIAKLTIRKYHNLYKRGHGPSVPSVCSLWSFSGWLPALVYPSPRTTEGSHHLHSESPCRRNLQSDIFFSPLNVFCTPFENHLFSWYSWHSPSSGGSSITRIHRILHHFYPLQPFQSQRHCVILGLYGSARNRHPQSKNRNALNVLMKLYWNKLKTSNTIKFERIKTKCTKK